MLLLPVGTKKGFPELYVARSIAKKKEYNPIAYEKPYVSKAVEQGCLR